jgi:hypothetical protein
MPRYCWGIHAPEGAAGGGHSPRRRRASRRAGTRESSVGPRTCRNAGPLACRNDATRNQCADKFLRTVTTTGSPTNMAHATFWMGEDIPIPVTGFRVLSGPFRKYANVTQVTARPEPCRRARRHSRFDELTTNGGNTLPYLRTGVLSQYPIRALSNTGSPKNQPAIWRDGSDRVAAGQRSPGQVTCMVDHRIVKGPADAYASPGRSRVT